MKTKEQLVQDAERAQADYLLAARQYHAAQSVVIADERMHKVHKARAVRTLLGGEAPDAIPQTNLATGKPHNPTSAGEFASLEPTYQAVLLDEMDHKLHRDTCETALRHAENEVRLRIALCGGSALGVM